MNTNGGEESSQSSELQKNRNPGKLTVEEADRNGVHARHTKFVFFQSVRPV